MSSLVAGSGEGGEPDPRGVQSGKLVRLLWHEDDGMDVRLVGGVVLCAGTRGRPSFRRV